jgi:amino acid adenylation domain-containing protein
VVDAHPVLRSVDFDPFAGASAREARLPLTEPQSEMWTAAAMGREANCSYNQCFAFTLEGPLRVESLRAALDGAVARHEALRAVIAADGTSQTIRPAFSVEMPLLDQSSLDPAASEREWARLLEKECETPFDLAEGPLVRAFVVRESAERHRFVLTAHHIVCDGWSSSVLFSELGLLYAADRVGIPAQLGPAASYRDYVAGLTSDDHVAAAAADEEFWASRYPDGAPVLDLPLTGARPGRKTYGSGREHLRIDAELYAAVRTIGARSGATLFATLLAAYEALVYRLSGQSDFVVGIPFADQLRLENSTLVAHCVNTVPLRARLDPASPFAEHVRTVGRELAEAQDHSRHTFGSLVRRLHIPRDPSRTPLVAMTFSIDKVGAPFDFGDVTIASLTTPKSYSNFELQVNVVDNGSDAVVECDYNEDLFDGATLRRWLSHYEALLRGIAGRPDSALQDLPLLAKQKEAALQSPVATSTFPPDRCLHERFEERARLEPARVAVVCDGESLTYGELDRRANALALKLRSLGVRPGVLVGIRTERSPNIVIGILGILKAGGAYLPLDPAYPKERVQFMLADSGVRVLVTESAFASDLQTSERELVFLDGEREQAAQGPESPLAPGDLAYVIYTSGSTGKPKGVLVSHYNVTRLFDATEAWFGFGADDVWTLFHSYAFDFSVWEIWGALLHGGRLVVVPYSVSRSPEAFRELLLHERVSVLNQTPSAFRQLIQADLQSAPALETDLRYVILGGEALELLSLRPWFERYGDQRPKVVNMYGITETTVHVTYRPISLRDVEAGAGSPIGVPIPDLSLLLLDPQGVPVPTGVPGEIYVGGAGVSQGYLERPELTAQRFLPDPSAAGRESKLYRTADLAKRLENGEVEYLGRIDDQVKLRGFRVELGEIEALLAEHPEVRACVVLAREDVPEDKRLVAYVVAQGEAGALLDELKSRLRAELPEYMVPGHFVLLPKLPLTPNGKIDRKALPAPEYGRRESARPYVAPRTPTESRIATIWSDALGIESPGVHDDFFDSGGHSLKAAQIVGALRSAFTVDVAMRHLFEQPTIGGLAEIVDVLAVAAAGRAGGRRSEREEIEL